MFRLNLPQYEIKITEKDGKRMIFDFLRRKYVALTPEEWVRQHFTHYLVEHKGYPKGLRCDSILYNKVAQPQMIIEYKAPTVPLQQKVFDQVSAYNLLLRVDYLVISNGMEHYCCKMDYEHQKYLFLQEIPDYEKL